MTPKPLIHNELTKKNRGINFEKNGEIRMLLENVPLIAALADEPTSPKEATIGQRPLRPLGHAN